MTGTGTAAVDRDRSKICNYYVNKWRRVFVNVKPTQRDENRRKTRFVATLSRGFNHHSHRHLLSNINNIINELRKEIES